MQHLLNAILLGLNMKSEKKFFALLRSWKILPYDIKYNKKPKAIVRNLFLHIKNLHNKTFLKGPETLIKI
jgi:hypothetical protein